MSRGRPSDPHRVGLVGTVTVHLLMVVAAVVLAQRAPAVQPAVYEVKLVAAPAPGQAPRRAVQEAVPESRPDPVPTAPVEAPAKTPTEANRPVPTPAPPPPPAAPPPAASTRNDPALPTRSDNTPLPGERPSTGQDILNFTQEGMRFEYPEYTRNVIQRILERWVNPVGNNTRLQTDILFTIQRDGSVTGISIGRRSGSTAFDMAAHSAVTRAAADRAFGPLPAGFSGESLPISFYFRPR